MYFSDLYLNAEHVADLKFQEESVFAMGPVRIPPHMPAAFDDIITVRQFSSPFLIIFLHNNFRFPMHSPMHNSCALVNLELLIRSFWIIVEFITEHYLERWALNLRWD